MAHTARKDDDKKEYFDPPDILEKKVDQLVEWIRESKHMITFTGAGVSTGAGIPDFRSGMNTSLQTGPGVWELRAHKSSREQKHKVTSTLKAIPTPTHMMIVKLQQEGILKCCVSQNTDGLHRRSGLPKSELCELHGNTNLERCKKCGREYLRDFRVRNAKRVHNHLTGRKCDDPICRGPLRDTIINFGEDLPHDELEKATDEGERADLCLAMGSSLTVTPAADIPLRVAERSQRLVIVNLQRTPMDVLASLCIHAKCEDVSQMVMKKLGLEIPEFRIKRQISIQNSDEKDSTTLSVQGRDMDGMPFSFFKEVHVELGRDRHSLIEPFNLKHIWKKEITELPLKITIHFNGHYGEPPITRNVIIKKGKDFKQNLNVDYNPFTQQWNVTDNDLSECVATMSFV